MKRLADFLKTLNRSKIINGLGAFFALAIPVLIVVGQNLPPTWKVAMLIASAVGVLARAQYIFQRVVPLLDGSQVIQVKAPSAGEIPSLISVAVNVADVIKPAGAVPVQPADPTPITIPIRPIIIKQLNTTPKP